MATNINTAFTDFLKNTVNLDPDTTSKARASKDWLISQINLLPGNSKEFPELVPDFHIHYGSFARRTKARELDDVDLMIGLHAYGASHTVYSNDYVVIYANSNSSTLNSLSSDGTTINSIKVINRFISHLSEIHQYRKAEINRRSEAAVLNLTSYNWTFDIVPCFRSVADLNGNTYYLIPDGKGNWKKTDPRIDKAKSEQINQRHDGNVLNLIRIIKYWNKRRVVTTIPSYLLENIILNYYSRSVTKALKFVDLEIPSLFEHLSSAIFQQVIDPKGIQGDLNSLSYADRSSISNSAISFAKKAREARLYETNGDLPNCFKRWGDVFGGSFPTYG